MPWFNAPGKAPRKAPRKPSGVSRESVIADRLHRLEIVQRELEIIKNCPFDVPVVLSVKAWSHKHRIWVDVNLYACLVGFTKRSYRLAPLALDDRQLGPVSYEEPKNGYIREYFYYVNSWKPFDLKDLPLLVSMKTFPLMEEYLKGRRT